jgi:hypothetical protein
MAAIIRRSQPRGAEDVEGRMCLIGRFVEVLVGGFLGLIGVGVGGTRKIMRDRVLGRSNRNRHSQKRDRASDRAPAATTRVGSARLGRIVS